MLQNKHSIFVVIERMLPNVLMHREFNVKFPLGVSFHTSTFVKHIPFYVKSNKEYEKVIILT